MFWVASDEERQELRPKTLTNKLIVKKKIPLWDVNVGTIITIDNDYMCIKDLNLRVKGFRLGRGKEIPLVRGDQLKIIGCGNYVLNAKLLGRAEEGTIFIDVDHMDNLIQKKRMLIPGEIIGYTKNNFWYAEEDGAEGFVYDPFNRTNAMPQYE